METATTTPSRPRGRWLRAIAAAALTLAGCDYQTKPPAPVTRYHPLPPDSTLPPFMRNTVRDMATVGNVGDFPVSSWGLVVNLRGTGDSTCPSQVRDWLVKDMSARGVGSRLSNYPSLTPEGMLDDPHVAVVGVIANIPPGARKGDYIDVMVQAMPGNNTSSLANGMLYRTDLHINGITEPVGAVAIYVKSQGNIFVNPFYAANTQGSPQDKPASGSRASLRFGQIPNGGLVTSDRPIHLVLRTPSWSTSRLIEGRINERFKTTDHWKDPAALAQDEGYLHLMVPASFHGDWRHFVGIATHLYLSNDPGFAAITARRLAEEAIKPNAKLMDISYCWEGIGPAAIPYITPLMSNPQPDVQFAAARAAALVGDTYGVDRLVQIAGTAGHAFQVNAIQVLGQLPESEMVDGQVARLCSSNQTLVRVAAYELLIGHNNPRIFSKVIHSRMNPENEFTLDLVNCEGPPLIYCTRVGRPRVAIFGHRVAMQTPVMFSAFDSRLTITQAPKQPDALSVFYRDEGRPAPVQILSPMDLGGIVARLGGLTDEGLHFTYGDVVAILQAMSDQKATPATFVLQELPDMAKQIQEAPALPESRPQTELTKGAPSAQLGASLPDLQPTTAPARPQ